MNEKNDTKKKKRAAEKMVSHLIKPQELSLEQWQIILRKQIAQEGGFRIENKGEHPVFSTFMVTNRTTKGVYRVVISGEKLGMNYCSCPDFAINTLGTCKHIEYVLRKLRGNKENRQILKQGFTPEYSCVTLKYGHERKIAFFPGAKASPTVKVLAGQCFDKEGFLTRWGFDNFDSFVAQGNSLNEDIYYHEDAMMFVAGIRDIKSRKERIDKIFSEGVNDKNIDKLLKMDLYPFQKEGVLFALNAGRCLLADDMGLGKTVQAIAVSELMAHCFGIEKVLIICPTSLKHQWQKEIEKFSDKKVVVVQKLLSRFSKFMQAVEKVADNLPQKSEQPSDAEIKQVNKIEEESLEEVQDEISSVKNEMGASPDENVFNNETIKNLLEIGSNFLKDLSNQLSNKNQLLKEAKTSTDSPIVVRKDSVTGRKILQISLPEDKTMENIAKLAGTFLNMLKPVGK